MSLDACSTRFRIRMSVPLVWGATALLAISIFAIGPVAAQQKITPAQREFFEKKIRPVLVSKCYSCHSRKSDKVRGGLVLDSREGIRTGGDSGHAVVPGELDSSLLIDAIRYESYEMPPEGPLPDAVVADFETWIRMGAPDPREGEAMIRREIDFESASHHWAFQPITHPSPPAVQQSSWPRSDVDRFVLSQLESEGIQPVADADRATLVRRLYFDLIGLPPTPGELNEVLQDESPAAVEKLVDRLLASPGFGERWGRHWLDVARYAESNGRERNFVYPHAWRYRDYVIDAFNQDKPFDQFLREQVAGDLLKDPSDEQRVATGFLAIGPKLLNEGNRNEFQMDLVDEQIDVTTRGFMALTVSCARCHDHKFDPIPTAEYYSLAGIFRSTRTLYGTEKQQGNRQASDLVVLGGNSPDQARQTAAAQRELSEVEKTLSNSRRQLNRKQGELRGLERRKGKRNQQQKQQLARLEKSVQQLRKRVKELQQQADQLQSSIGDLAMGVQDGNVVDSPIYVRGEVSNPKGKAPRGLLTILDPDLQQPLLESTAESGRRELAAWMISSQNPLTARVAVNRIWSHLFGRGIVATVDNFGTTGESPSHPQLLDFLASEFRDQGWSVKSLIRSLVLSRSYQLSSQFDAGNYDRDPDNRLYWRYQPKRLDAEAIRDAMLFASGKLDLTPVEGSPMSDLDGEFSRVVRRFDEFLQLPHRSVYLPIIRNAVPESLQLFDFAEPSMLVGARAVTTVPTQALFFLNSDFVVQQSDGLAESLVKNQNLDDRSRVELAYRTILSRQVQPEEVSRALQFVSSFQKRLDDGEPRLTDNGNAERKQKTLSPETVAWSGLVQALFGSAEFRYLD